MNGLHFVKTWHRETFIEVLINAQSFPRTKLMQIHDAVIDILHKYVILLLQNSWTGK